MKHYYPGGDYVNWLGLSVVDNPAVAPDRKSNSFPRYFQVLHKTVRMHDAYSIRQKPILITHLESTTDAQGVHRWTTMAIEAIEVRYPEVRGVILASEPDIDRYQSQLIKIHPNQ